MRYSEIKEVYNLFEGIKQDWLGEFDKVDIRAFLAFIENDIVMKNQNWTRYEPMKYDLEDFFKDYRIEWLV